MSSGEEIPATSQDVLLSSTFRESSFQFSDLSLNSSLARLILSESSQAKSFRSLIIESICDFTRWKLSTLEEKITHFAGVINQGRAPPAPHIKKAGCPLGA